MYIFKFILIAIGLIFLCHCSHPAAKYLSDDYQKPKRIAILPTDNQTVDIEAAQSFRKVLYLMMQRADYTWLVEPEEVDSILNEEGITDAGQLPTIENMDLFRALRVDGLMFTNLLEARIFELSLSPEQALSANLKLVRPPSNLVWEHEYADVGTRFGLIEKMRYTFAGVDEHPLLPHMEEVLINTLKTLPGYIDRDFPATVYSINAGYFLPVGTWNNHRYADGIEHFQGGPGLSVQIEQKFTLFGFGLRVGYFLLSTGEWADYLENQGIDNKGSAFFWHIDGLINIYPWVDRNNIFKTELGIIYLNSGGQETFSGESYDYDFLSWGLGFTAGIEYNRFISDYTALVLDARYLVAGNAIEYADGKNDNLTGFVFSLGLKIFH